MEPITPKTSENKTSQKGVKFWAVEDNAGTKYTIWDEAIAQIWEANFGNEMEMDVKRSGNFLNIRGIGDVCSVIKAVPSSRPVRGFDGLALKEVQNGVRSLNGQSSIKEEYNKEQPSLLEEADKEIVRLKKVVLNYIRDARDINEQKPIRVDGTYCGNYNKDKSIIAQCLVKAVIGQTRLCKEAVWTIEAAVDMYKEASELLG